MKKVCFVGAPGTGKSSMAYGLMYHLKSKGYEVEFVPELMKHRVILGEDNSKDSVALLNYVEQEQLESKYSQLDIDYLVCETSQFSPYIYARYYAMSEEIQELFKTQFIKTKYDTVFFVRPSKFLEKDYHQFGRSESYKQSMEIDGWFKTCLLAYKIEYSEIYREYSLETLYKLIGEIK